MLYVVWYLIAFHKILIRLLSTNSINYKEYEYQNRFHLPDYFLVLHKL